jgi:COP9 signalosome complex subunit 4
LIPFALTIKSLPPEKFDEIATFTIGKIKANANSFDEADYILRDALFQLYLSYGQFTDAANILSGLNLESNLRIYTDIEKADIYIKCAEAYLAEDGAIDAEVFVNKARVPMETVQELPLKLRYKAALARILDANRKFTEAAKQYYDLSTMTYPDVRSFINSFLL